MPEIILGLHHDSHLVSKEWKLPPLKTFEIDFTYIQPSRRLRYLLVIVCTYSDWVRAFPTRTERSREVAKVPLREIVSRFGLPSTIHNDNESAFVTDVVQMLTKFLNIT